MPDRRAARIEVSGLREAQRALSRLGEKELAADLRRANKRAAEIVADDAEPAVPRRSGRLAKSLRATARNREASVQAGSAGVPYAGVVHYGWPARRIKPHPFLLTALRRTRGEVRTVYARLLDEVVAAVNARK